MAWKYPQLALWGRSLEITANNMMQPEEGNITHHHVMLKHIKLAKQRSFYMLHYIAACIIIIISLPERCGKCLPAYGGHMYDWASSYEAKVRYKLIDRKHTMAEHIKVMLIMICDLKDAGKHLMIINRYLLHADHHLFLEALN